jgi:hypothetical protein
MVIATFQNKLSAVSDQLSAVSSQFTVHSSQFFETASTGLGPVEGTPSFNQQSPQTNQLPIRFVSTNIYFDSADFSDRLGQTSRSSVKRKE